MQQSLGSLLLPRSIRVLRTEQYSDTKYDQDKVDSETGLLLTLLKDLFRFLAGLFFDFLLPSSFVRSSRDFSLSFLLCDPGTLEIRSSHGDEVQTLTFSQAA